MASGVTRPIGMFDSGFGGLTVARAVIDLLPAEDLVYIGDTGRYPYGPKPAAEVRGYAHELAWSLVHDFDVKAIVIACNTAASVAFEELAAELPVPIISVIEPGAHALSLTTRNKKSESSEQLALLHQVHINARWHRLIQLCNSRRLRALDLSNLSNAAQRPEMTSQFWLRHFWPPFVTLE